MLELCGREYLIDHVISELENERKHMVFQVYVTDVLRGILQVTAKLGGGNVEVERYAKLIEPVKDEKRTSEEIIDTIQSKLTQMMGGEDDDAI